MPSLKSMRWKSWDFILLYPQHQMFSHPSLDTSSFTLFEAPQGGSVSIQRPCLRLPTLWNIPLNLTAPQPLNIFSTTLPEFRSEYKFFIVVWKECSHKDILWHLSPQDSYATQERCEPLITTCAKLFPKYGTSSLLFEIWHKFPQIFVIYQCIFIIRSSSSLSNISAIFHDAELFWISLTAGLHKLWYPSIRDTSTWSKFGAHGEHRDVFLFSNLGALWF